MAARFGYPEEREHHLRAAVTILVDAFLHDREANADLFAAAHDAGAELNQEVGCEWRYEPADRSYSLDCAIFGLHSVCGTSIAWTVLAICSICGADAFTCDHVPGEEYDGETCSFSSGGVLNMGHLALTANPDFAYTWHWPQKHSAKKLIAMGLINRPGDVARCTHCDCCYGRVGPDEGDLDPVGRWRALVEQHLGDQ